MDLESKVEVAQDASVLHPEPMQTPLVATLRLYRHLKLGRFLLLRLLAGLFLTGGCRRAHRTFQG